MKQKVPEQKRYLLNQMIYFKVEKGILNYYKDISEIENCNLWRNVENL